jgi:hypothetical protein
MLCLYCDGTGNYQKPLDEECYADYYGKFFDSGLFNEKMARDIALIEAGYEFVPCPYCDNGR